ncbi:MAG: hypothetical protein JWN86_2933 [Planctomycetota bacterium]|nr:hypothetical protein [Planctomycetota bacterium]
MTDAGTLFDTFDSTLSHSGPEAAIDHLVAAMEEKGDPRALLDALLLKARHDLGLPSVQVGPLSEIEEPARTKFEDRYVEAIRYVGTRLLNKGDLVSAWPYFRAIGEKEPIIAALDAFSPGDGQESVGHVVEIAFNQGVHPRRGFELILDHFGVCSAISSFEGLPPDETIRRGCSESLVRRLHEHLIMSLRAEVERRGEALPPEGTSVPRLIEGRDWLFADDAYHLDVSHLGAVVRVAPMAEDRETLEKAVELTEYGRHLSDRHQYDGEPPFDRLYEDHGIYLRGLLGRDEDTAISHFGQKLPPIDPDGDGDTLPAQILVRLLVRMGRLEEAIDVSAEHLARVPEGMLMVPGLTQLCGRAGRLDRLAMSARALGDPVKYAAAILSAS